MDMNSIRLSTGSSFAVKQKKRGHFKKGTTTNGSLKRMMKGASKGANFKR
jgi:hypothetical protein